MGPVGAELRVASCAFVSTVYSPVIDFNCM